MLTDPEVQKQITHMMAFIEQEANEKTEEIDAKAEEEFNIEKGKLVQQQRKQIMEYYEKKEKQVAMNKLIQSSQLHNQARLNFLKSRDDLIRDLIEECRRRLPEITANEKYATLLEDLILQGLFLLYEKNVVLRCREEDKGKVQTAFGRAASKYKKATGKDVSMTIDSTNLQKHIAGGVEMYAMKGKVKVENTLDARLDVMANKLIPQIRTAIFGANPNRTFVD